MKKVSLLVVMLGTMLLILAACGDGDQDSDLPEEVESTTSDAGDETNQEETSVNEEEQTTEETEEQDETETTDYEGPSEIIRDNREGVNPVRIEIPAIGVDAEIERAGTLENGQMGVPDGSENVAWYEEGTQPGAPGNSVMAGHVDDTVNPAVFYDLEQLQEGDEVIVTGEDGNQLTFEVYRSEVYPTAESPLKQIFGYSHSSNLNLITCDGDVLEDHSREDRLVVYTKLVQE
ncbi:class F sortase [Halalkalibacillus halophilus]|uniref:class F sortase n=1 Tax=Halalkalibacillus halophilus TaxID=392827 RepID=UPI00042112C5|nr:class F sortase [Halalkalibacillus halophilus]